MSADSHKLIAQVFSWLASSENMIVVGCIKVGYCHLIFDNPTACVSTNIFAETPPYINPLAKQR